MLESNPSGISASERAALGVALFLLLLLKPRAINSGVKGQSPLVYNSVRSSGRMAHQAYNQERSYHYGQECTSNL